MKKDSILNRLSNFLSGRKINKVEDLVDSQSFCMMPWVHLYVAQMGKVTPCCVSSWGDESFLGDVNTTPILDIWKGKKMNTIRSQMLKDKEVKSCWQCYENEKAGIKSHRKLTNMRFDHKFDWVKETSKNGEIVNSKPIYWDIRISNLCNLKCRICGHHSSSKWFEDAKALDEQNFETKLHYSINNFASFLKQLEEVMPIVEEVTLLGGEPALMKEQLQILEGLIEKGNTEVQIRLITNLTVMNYGKFNLYDTLKSFSKVSIHASLDDTGERGELQRKGTDWETVLANREKIVKLLPQAEFFVQPTISIFNIFTICDFHKKWVSEGLVDADKFLPHTLKTPEEYCIKVLPANEKKIIEEKFLAHLNWLDSLDLKTKIFAFTYKEFKNTINFMNSEDWTHLIPKFIEKTEKLDNLRNEKTFETIPELKALLNHQKL